MEVGFAIEVPERGRYRHGPLQRKLKEAQSGFFNLFCLQILDSNSEAEVMDTLI